MPATKSTVPKALPVSIEVNNFHLTVEVKQKNMCQFQGFWISSVQIFSGVFYISTYEGVRHILSSYGANQQTKSLIGGGCASLVGQTIIVPFDVISQHAMVLGMGQGKGAGVNPLGINHTSNRSRFRISMDIAKEIFRRDGFKGYYRGYNASLMAYVPNSAMWYVSINGFFVLVSFGFFLLIAMFLFV